MYFETYYPYIRPEHSVAIQCNAEVIGKTKLDFYIEKLRIEQYYNQKHKAKILGQTKHILQMETEHSRTLKEHQSEIRDF